MEQLIIFVVLWFLLSSYSVYRIISLLAVSGKVTADDRFAVLLAMTPPKLCGGSPADIVRSLWVFQSLVM